MALGLVDQDKSATHKKNADGSIQGSYRNGNKPVQAVNPLAVHVDPNGVDDPSRSGAEGDHFQTLEFAMANKSDALDDHYYYRGGVHTKVNTSPITGWSYQQEISRSGTPEKPLIIEPRPGETAVIDMQNQGGAFSIIRAANIIIRNFEIRNCDGSACYTGNDGNGNRCADVLFDSLWIHGVNGTAGTNVGGIRFDDIDRGIARNNIIHNIRVGNSNNNNAAAIHGYRMADMLIELNTLFDVYHAVFHKLSTGDDGLLVRLNMIRQTKTGVHYDIQGLGSPIHKNQRVTQNIFDGVESDVWMNTIGASGNNDGLHVWNNTFVNALGCLSHENNARNVNSFNNIFSGPALERALMTRTPTLPTLYSDYNLYDIGDDKFQLDKETGTQENYDALQAWRDARNQDLNSSVGNPLFVNAAAKDFRLQAGSPALSGGRGGQYSSVRGAFITGNERIGSNR